MTTHAVAPHRAHRRSRPASGPAERILLPGRVRLQLAGYKDVPCPARCHTPAALHAQLTPRPLPGAICASQRDIWTLTPLPDVCTACADRREVWVPEAVEVDPDALARWEHWHRAAAITGRIPTAARLVGKEVAYGYAGDSPADTPLADLPELRRPGAAP